MKWAGVEVWIVRFWCGAEYWSEVVLRWIVMMCRGAEEWNEVTRIDVNWRRERREVR